MQREPDAASRGPQPAGSPPGNRPLETGVALGLCTLILLSSIAFLETDSRLVQTIQEQGARRGTLPVPAEPTPPLGAAPTLVVLISVDTLRADRLDAYGYGRETAPNLAELAAEGVRFATVGAQSAQTLTSHKSLLTGKYPASLMLEAGARTVPDDRSPRAFLVDTFAAAQGTLAEHLREAGYTTAAFTDGGWLCRETGFDHGFDRFDESGGGLAAVLPRALDWLDQARPEQAFLFVHGYDVHCPYPCREPYNSRFCTDHDAHVPLERMCGKGELAETPLTERDLQAISDHYDGGVRSADAYLGRLFDELRERGLFEDALIVVTSDHGESLGERGIIGHGGLYPEQLMVPLILKTPRRWRVPPTVVEEPVELVDLWPTLVQMCGAELDETIDGASLVPLLLRRGAGKRYLVAQTTFEEAPAFVSNPSKRSLMDPENWQLIHDGRGAVAEYMPLGPGVDPAEPARRIRSQDYPELMGTLLDTPAKGARPSGDPPRAAGTSPAFEERIRRLGYGTDGR